MQSRKNDKLKIVETRHAKKIFMITLLWASANSKKCFKMTVLYH